MRKEASYAQRSTNKRIIAREAPTLLLFRSPSTAATANAQSMLGTGTEIHVFFVSRDTSLSVQ
jgi:hypothetical protein